MIQDWRVSRVVLSDGRTSLILSTPRESANGQAENLSVTIEGPDLRTGRQVYEGWTGGFESLATFRADLAARWRGWDGVLTYRSTESDFQILAKHDHHVNLELLLCESAQPEGWGVQCELRLDASEQLSRAADDVSNGQPPRDAGRTHS